MRWWWQLWTVALFPLPALQAEEASDPSKGGPLRHLNKTGDGVLHTTASWGNQASRTWPTQKTPRPSDGGWATEIARLRTTEESSSTSTENKTRRLLRPTIAVSSVNGTCNITLHCTVTGGGGDVNFTWFHGEWTEAVLSSEPTLRITQRPPDGSLDYTCAVRTKESQSASTVSLADHCHDSPGFSAGSYVKYLIPLVVALVILLILFGMYRRKKGERGRRSGTISLNEPSGFHAGPRGDPTNHGSLNQLQRHRNPRGAGSTPEPGMNLASWIRSSRVSGSRRDLRCRKGAGSDTTSPKTWLGKKHAHILGGNPLVSPIHSTLRKVPRKSTLP